MNIASPQAQRAQLRDGSSSASVPLLSRELYEIGAKLREASESYNRALNLKDDPWALIDALIDFKSNAMKMLTLDQALERKLIAHIADHWDECREVYR